MTDNTSEEGEARSLLQAGLLILAVLLVASGFVYLIYGMSEDITALKEGRATRPYKSIVNEQQDDSSTTIVLPVQKNDQTYAPIKAEPNGTVTWKIRVAPRTPLIKLNINAVKSKRPIRIRFLTSTPSSPITPVATIWAGPAASTEISLPAGSYRIGLSTPGRASKWNPNTTDAYFMDEMLDIAYPASPSDPPTLTIDHKKKPVISGQSGYNQKPKIRATTKPKVPATPEPPDSYEGLGEGASDGGTPTYG